MSFDGRALESTANAFISYLGMIIVFLKNICFMAYLTVSDAVAPPMENWAPATWLNSVSTGPGQSAPT